MKITVEFYGIPRQRAGVDRLVLDALAEPARLADVLQAVAVRAPSSPPSALMAAGSARPIWPTSVATGSSPIPRRAAGWGGTADPVRGRGRLSGGMTASNSPSPPGYHGRYLRIDVSSGNAESVPLDPAELRQFLGGSGLGVQLLLRENAATAEPLSPDAALVFVFSPLVGSPLTTSAKFAVVSKSPLTDRLNDSLASSGFALAGKKTGCDALLLTGRAARPSIVVIDDGQVRLEPAGDLWGETISRRQQRLRAAVSRRLQLRGDRAGRRTAGAVCDDLPRRPARRPRWQRGGAGRQEPQGRGGARQPALSLGGAAGVGSLGQVALNQILRTRHGQVPGTRAPRPICSSSIGCGPCPRGTSSAAASRAPPTLRRKLWPAGRPQDAGLVCRLHDRLRAHLPAQASAPAARACGSSTKTCLPWGRCAASATRRSCWPRRSVAMNWGWTRSVWAAPLAFAMECVERGLLGRSLAAFRRRGGLVAGHRGDWTARRPGRPAGRGQPPSGLGDRARRAGLRAPGQRLGVARLRAAGFADDGPGLRRRHARGGP